MANSWLCITHRLLGGRLDAQEDEIGTPEADVVAIRQRQSAVGRHLTVVDPGAVGGQPVGEVEGAVAVEYHGMLPRHLAVGVENDVVRAVRAEGRAAVADREEGAAEPEVGCREHGEHAAQRYSGLAGGRNSRRGYGRGGGTAASGIG